MIPSTPPDPYALKAIETVTKTAVELIHQDVKIGLSSLLQIIKERGAEKAKENVEKFDQALTEEMNQRFSVDLTPDGYERISGNLNDPDFAYLVQQATISSARTSNTDKHKLLARAVTERMIAKPEGLVALASAMACAIVPNLTVKQLNFLGLAAAVLGIRPNFDPNRIKDANANEQQQIYLQLLEGRLNSFFPFPNMEPVDYVHLQTMSCITYSAAFVLGGGLSEVLMPKDLPLFVWPDDLWEGNRLFKELESFYRSGLDRSNLTTVGIVVGTHIHDLKLKTPPTRFTWNGE